MKSGPLRLPADPPIDPSKVTSAQHGPVQEQAISIAAHPRRNADRLNDGQPAADWESPRMIMELVSRLDLVLKSHLT